MLLINKVKLIIFAVSNLLITISICFFGYLNIIKYSIEIPSFKYIAEQFIFFMLISILITIFMIIYVLYRQMNVLHELDKIMILSRTGNYTDNNALTKIGTIGIKISQLQNELSIINNKKSLRISSLSSIINTLSTITISPVVVCDIIKRINYSSKQLSSIFNINNDYFKGLQITEFINIDFRQIINDIKNSPMFSSIQINDVKIFVKGQIAGSCNPEFIAVKNNDGEISDLITVIHDLQLNCNNNK